MTKITMSSTTITENTNPETYPRKAWLAALLNAVAFPLGYIYVGRWQRALTMFVFLPLGFFVFAWTGALGKFYGLIASIVFLGALYVFFIVDVVRLARHEKDYTLKSYNRWYYYIVIYLALSFATETLKPYRGDIYGYDFLRFPSGSMMPTVLAGDFVIANTRYYGNHKAQRGDIVAFDYPKDPSVVYAKRIIGLPGDRIQYVNKQIIINGEPVEQTFIEDYVPENDRSNLLNRKAEHVENFQYSILIDNQRPIINGEFTIPEGQYFVMGDNRDNSNDSRFWGFVPQDNIKAKILYVWLSYSPYDYSFRSERMGLRLDQPDTGVEKAIPQANS